jgi:hypothetical protein
VKDDSSDHMMSFQLSDIQVLCSWHRCLRICALLSVIKSLAIAVLPQMLHLWSSRWPFIWKQGLQDEYLVLLHFPCAAVVLRFFETTLLNVRRTFSVSVEFRPLFLFADIVFPWFVYVDITLETVALGTPNNVAVFSQMLQLNAHQRSVLYQNWTCLPFSGSFTWTATQHNH